MGKKKFESTPTSISQKSIAVHKKINCSPTAKTEEQKLVLKSFADNTVSIVYGPCGTGKSLMAVWYGLNELLNGRYEKLIFTRPCIESYESIGWLPGTKEQKLSPFVAPSMSYLEEKIDNSYIQKLVTNNQIITLPLGYIRGYTFKDTIIILDEAQNTQIGQMRLFLTRIGERSKAIVIGDCRQSDIGMKNGLEDAINRLKGIENLGIIELSEKSIIRSKIVADIEKKYEEK